MQRSSGSYEPRRDPPRKLELTFRSHRPLPLGDGFAMKSCFVFVGVKNEKGAVSSYHNLISQHGLRCRHGGKGTGPLPQSARGVASTSASTAAMVGVSEPVTWWHFLMGLEFPLP
jgi:hypothetical protein